MREGCIPPIPNTRFSPLLFSLVIHNVHQSCRNFTASSLVCAHDSPQVVYNNLGMKGPGVTSSVPGGLFPVFRRGVGTGGIFLRNNISDCQFGGWFSLSCWKGKSHQPTHASQLAIFHRYDIVIHPGLPFRIHVRVAATDSVKWFRCVVFLSLCPLPNANNANTM